MRYETKDGTNVYNTQLVQERERMILIEKEQEEERSMNQSLTLDWNEYKKEDERLQGRLTKVLQKRTLDKRRNKEEIDTLTYVLGATTLNCLSQQKDMRQTIQSWQTAVKDIWKMGEDVREEHMAKLKEMQTLFSIS